ncbi:MAG: hypothetical protein K2H67_03425 [Treponemataceae bacterium]|nr:hypothetical protein [Treponemataceae bacterium]
MAKTLFALIKKKPAQASGLLFEMKMKTQWHGRGTAAFALGYAKQMPPIHAKVSNPV